MSRSRAKHVTVRKARQGPEDEHLDREFWERMPPVERVNPDFTALLRELSAADTGITFEAAWRRLSRRAWVESSAISSAGRL